MKKFRHFMYVPWTGLGLYGGFRGNRWLKNRIKVFKQFVVPSLLSQTSNNFTLWCSWRREEKHNPYVKELIKYLEGIEGFKTVHTFHGVCFWDDKYPDVEARERLITAVHASAGELLDTIGEVDYVYMTIQPSDDCYIKDAVLGIQGVFAANPSLQAFGFKKGYMANYRTKEIHEYNPTTNPPFFTIKFPKETFIIPHKHLDYTGPYKSHEYVGDKLNYGAVDVRGFLVGTHGENISTVFNHPFKGAELPPETWKQFGLEYVPPLVLKTSIRKAILRKLSHNTQRKIRYWIGERFWHKIYEFLRA